MKLLLFCGLLGGCVLFSGCNHSSNNSNKNSTSRPNRDTKHTKTRTDWDTTYRQPFDDSNLTDVQKLNPRIRVDLKYATSDNFMHQVMYTKLKKAYLQKDVALRLALCQHYLSGLDSSLHLLIYDAVRPVSVQWKMWKALDTLPVSERIKFVSNPVNKSLHNYGAAVDLTLCRSDNTPLDMGADFDDIRPLAYPRLEQQFLSNGMLTTEQVNNRKLLRKVMLSQGFHVLSTEWWHFNACSRTKAKQKYTLLEKES